MNPIKIRPFLGFVITLFIVLAIVPLIKSEISENARRSEHFEHFEHSEHSEHSIITQTNDSQGEFYMGVGENPFWVKEQNFILWLHIISMTISFGILIPTGITLGFANVKSKWYINIYIIGLITSVMGFLFGIMFSSSKSQDIYPANFHSKFGWIILIVLLIQMSIGFIQFMFDDRNNKIRKVGFMKIRLNNESNESLVDSTSSESSHDIESSALLDNSNVSSQKEFTKTTPKQHEFQYKLSYVKTTYNVISYTLIILVYSQFLLGFITLSDTCHGEALGNCLAHYVKGSIFILFGLVTFARYLGFFEKFGWEWNILSINSSNDFNGEKNQKGKISFSLVESIIIFTYGISNTFLEHTGNNPWNHRDIQHASLAFMWWWAGSLGIILENKRIRKFLFSNPSNLPTLENPTPSIIFIITAISMGSHHQKTEFSLNVHKQFGGFLLLAGLFRLFTIIILYFNNNINNNNSNINDNNNNNNNTIIHPPTEFIASFCFVGSGITLMIANKSTAFLFDSIYDFDVNFILHLVISLSFFTLSFIMIFLFIYRYSLSYSK